jgi:hypothetical protein
MYAVAEFIARGVGGWADELGQIAGAHDSVGLHSGVAGDFGGRAGTPDPPISVHMMWMGLAAAGGR